MQLLMKKMQTMPLTQLMVDLVLELPLKINGLRLNLLVLIQVTQPKQHFLEQMIKVFRKMVQLLGCYLT